MNGTEQVAAAAAAARNELKARGREPSGGTTRLIVIPVEYAHKTKPHVYGNLFT